MTGNLNLFSNLDTVQTDVTLGNNVQVTILGKCTIGILTKQGEQNFMHDVYHIEGMKHNLLSIGQLILKGYRVYLEDNHRVIKDIQPRNQLIAKVPVTSNHLFPLTIVPDMKGNENTRYTFNTKSKEEDKHCDKK